MTNPAGPRSRSSRTRLRLRPGEGAAVQEAVATVAANEGLPEAPVQAILSAVDRETETTGWAFVMISVAQFEAVHSYLLQQSATPIVAVRLWVRLFQLLDGETGEVRASRKRLAEAVGTAPAEVSRIMVLLEKANVIRREREEGRVRYFVNPHIATTLPRKEREVAQQKAGPIALVA